MGLTERRTRAAASELERLGLLPEGASQMTKLQLAAYVVEAVDREGDGRSELAEVIRVIDAAKDDYKQGCVLARAVAEEALGDV